jgi:hypothetical protein
LPLQVTPDRGRNGRTIVCYRGILAGAERLLAVDP